MTPEQTKLYEVLFSIRYTGRDMNNLVQQSMTCLNDLDASDQGKRTYAAEALPVKLASILRDLEALNNTAPSLRAFLSPPSPSYPAGIAKGGFSIQTKYCPPTDTKGSRIKAWRVDRLSNGKTESLFCSFSYGAHCPHEEAALAWFSKFGKNLDIPGGFTLHKGSCVKGYVFTINFNTVTA